MSAKLTEPKAKSLLCTKIKDFNTKGHSRNTAYGVFMNLEHADGTALSDRYPFWETIVAECLDVAYGPRVTLEEGF